MTESAIYCANHPQRETTLRCSKCGKPICAQCAVRTPVGYRCRECVRNQQRIFNTSRPYDFPLAGLLALVGVGLAIIFLNFLGFWGLFLAPVVGGGIAEVIRWAVRRRRHRWLPAAAAGGGALGALVYLLNQGLPLLLLGLYGGGLPPGYLVSALIGIAWPLAYAGLIITTMFYRLRGIQL